MLSVISASLAKYSFSQVLRRVYEGEETLVIERAGFPVVAIVSISDLQRLYPEKSKTLPRVAVGARRERAWKSLMNLLDEPGSEQYSEAEVEADVLKAVEEVRSSKHHGRA